MSTSSELIVALDLGTKCGFAVLRGRKRIESGRWSLMPTKAKRVHVGERWLNFERAVRTLINKHRPDVLAFEMVRRHIGSTAAHVYGGWLAGLERYQLQRILDGDDLIPTMPLEVGTWKKAATGKGNATKDEIKVVVRKRFRYAVKSEDEADALAIGEAARLIRLGKYTP